jgi:rhodanese-related sulfurtransferase
VSLQASQPALRATPEQLAMLAPLGSLSTERLRELADVATLERVPRGSDPLASYKGAPQSVFLLRGEVLLMFEGGGTLVVVGGTGDGRLPLNRRANAVARARAINDAELIALDDEVLDILVTFGQMAAGETAVRVARSIFSLSNLRDGVFSRLPPARIDELLARFERIDAKRGEVVIREGEEGDYYYVIESGRCEVERKVGGVRVALAELKAGDAFGEEALASDARRNATVILASDGRLLRLGKTDFKKLLGEPLLQRVDYAGGLERVATGATWLDVRYPSEYRYDRLPGALNVPLNEVRNSFPVLEPSREYVVYCQSGRRSSAAAFLFAQRGFRVSLLQGGLWAAGRGR